MTPKILTKTSSSRIANVSKPSNPAAKKSQNLAQDSQKPATKTAEAAKHQQINFETETKATNEASHSAENYQFSLLAEHLQQWIEKNSKPKKLNLSKWFVRREPTRWAKRGPMATRDWMRFYKWADKKAAPKQTYSTPSDYDINSKLKKSKEPLSLAELMEHASDLAIPRVQNRKYQYPEIPVYAYAPQINPKKPAKKDRGRPIAPPNVPKVFQHIDLEIDFWSKLRFPVKSSTAYYNPTLNIVKLAEPKIVPPIRQHCPIPEKPVEYVAPRRRMTSHQWREHKKHLIYLAKPLRRS